MCQKNQEWDGSLSAGRFPESAVLSMHLVLVKDFSSITWCSVPSNIISNAICLQYPLLPILQEDPPCHICLDQNMQSSLDAFLAFQWRKY